MLRLPTFGYHRPQSVDEALRVAKDHGPEASFVAGGTDLYPNMKRRHQRPKQVISLGALGELHHSSGDPGAGMTLGAMMRLSEIEHSPLLREHYPAVAEAASLVSTPLLRNMGTLGGNLLLDTRCNYYDQTHEWRESVNFCMKCDGDTCWVAPSSPRCWAVQSSDSAPLLCAMGAEVTLRSADGGERRLPLGDLYRDDGIAYVAKDPSELMTSVHLPALNGWRASYRKLRRRGTFDFPVLGVGACVWTEGGVITDVKIRIGGAGSWPIAATAAEEMLRGQTANEELVREAAASAYKPARAMDNTDHEARWRKRMAPVFVTRALFDCLGWTAD
ncbi:MAG: xanthine dehydrogenase family protein subunit M [Planctomycetota bacterium]